MRAEAAQQEYMLQNIHQLTGWQSRFSWARQAQPCPGSFLREPDE